MKIHPTAVIDSSAELADDIEIGPFCIIKEQVRIGSGTRLLGQVFIDKWTEIGRNNEIHYGAVIGHDPQHKKYTGCRSYTKIGDNNIIREYVTIHRSFQPEQSTVIGNGNFIMATAHIAHDCKIGNDTVIVNGALLGGHVVVDDCVYISGNVAVHQFVHIGKLAIISGLTRVSKDVLPFSIIEGNSYFRGINTVGLRRAGYDQRRRQIIEQAYRILFWQHLSIKEAIAELEKIDSEDVRLIIESIRSSKRGFCRPRPGLQPTEDTGIRKEDEYQL